MADTLNGLLSGKYDSTKQRAILLNGDRLRNYRSYTATMRLELLLTGHLIFTDAQFFDGLYFHWLCKDKSEFNSFENLMVPFEDTRRGSIPLFSISVKCRELNPDKMAVNTFCKEFQFSSLEDDALSEAVFALSSDYSECYTYVNSKFDEMPEDEKIEKHVHPSESTLEDYIFSVAKQLEKLYGERSNVLKTWLEYGEELKVLFSVKRLDKWGYLDATGNWSTPDWKDITPRCLGQMFPEKPGSQYFEVLRDKLKEAEGPKGMNKNPAAMRYFARINGELNKNIGNRSKITTALDAIEHLNNLVTVMKEKTEDRGRREYANECFRDFRQLMNDRYNKVLAIQHGCQFLDLCDYTNIFSLINKDDMHNVDLPAELVEQLAELSWSDFGGILMRNRDELEYAFQAWMCSYNSFRTNPDLQNLCDGVDQYVKRLNSVFAGRKSSLGITIKPWDMEGTCQDNIRDIFIRSYSYRYYLVGGGSFEANTEGNEICILGVAEHATTKEKLGLVRLRINTLDADAGNVETDYVLDTLLAPVCNPLNGGYI